MQGDVLQAWFRFVVSRHGNRTVIGAPPLTPFLGLWYFTRKANYSKDLSHQKDIVNAIVERLPEHDILRLRLPPEITNWLPFHWRGFEQTTHYTYRLIDLSDVERVWAGFQDKVRTDVRKAAKTLQLASEDMGALAPLIEKTFQRQNAKSQVSRETLERVWTASREHGDGQILIARDDKGRPHSGALFIRDKNVTYYMLGGSDPELRNSGAASFVLWQGIQNAVGKSTVFDFEGSMIEPVERFFRGFGALQTPCHMIVRERPRVRLRRELGRFIRSVWSSS